MKTFRKALSIILGLAIMLSCIAGMQVSVAAEGTLALSVGEATIADGVVTVPVVANGSFQALGITVSYDGTVLKLREADKADLGVETADQATSSPLTANPFVMQWAFAEETTDVAVVDGTIATLTFDVLNAEAETATIDLEVTEAWDVAGNEVTATANDGTVTFKVPECEHDYTITNNTATKDAAGTATKVCSKCGDTIETYFPRIVRFAAVTLVLQDNISIKFKADAKYLTSFGGDYEALYCKFVLDGQEYTVTDYEIENPDTTKPRAVFTFSKLKSYQMGLDVNATVYGVYNGEHLDGQGINNSVLNYGVYSYCNSKFKEDATDDDDIKFNTLLADLINYGDVSQRFNNQYLEEGLVSTLVPAGLLGYKTTEERTYTKISNTKVEEIENPSYRFRAVGLVTEAAIVMRLRVDNYEYKTIGSMDSRDDFAGLAFKVSCDGKEWVFKPDEMTDEEFNSRFQPHPEGGYYFLFNGLVSYQFSSDVNFIICRNDESLTPLSNTLGYSIEAYATSKVGGTDAALTEMCRAIMNFGDSAAKYF